MWMNEDEIENAQHGWSDHPVMGPATRTLAGLVDAVNGCSDGWPYWRAPSRAAAKLQELITAHDRWERSEFQRPREGEEATPARLQAAYTQLKAFRTRQAARGKVIEFRLYPADGVTNASPRRSELPEPVTKLIPLTRRERDLLGGGVAKLLMDPGYVSITDELVDLGRKVRAGEEL